jgi:hypothetical protein
MGMRLGSLRALSTSLILGLSLVSCNKESGGKAQALGDTTRQNRDVNPEEPKPKTCKSSRILEILTNGETVVSRLKMDRAKIVSWSLDSGKVIRQLDYPISYHRISPNGNFILRKINFKKYQLLEFVKEFKKNNKTLTFNSSDTPDMHFSSDSKHLIIRYQPQYSGYTDQIALFNLKKMKFTTNFKMKFVEYVDLTKDSKYFVVGTDDGFEKKIHKVDAKTLETVISINLPRYQDFTLMELGLNTILVKSRRDFIFYDLETGEKRFESNYRFYHGMNSQGTHAIFANDWSEVRVVNIDTLAEDFVEKKPEGLSLHTCKFNGTPDKLVCKDNVNMGKVITWKLRSKELKTSCY